MPVGMVRDLADHLDLVAAPRQSLGERLQARPRRGHLGGEELGQEKDSHARPAGRLDEALGFAPRGSAPVPASRWTSRGSQASAPGAHQASRRDLGDPGRFSSARSFSPPVGSFFEPGELGGYYIDFTPEDRRAELAAVVARAARSEQLHVATAQWGLGCYERYLTGEGEAWLEAAARSRPST